MNNSTSSKLSSQQLATLPEQLEWERCRRDVCRFLSRHCQVENATDRQWIPFHLWPAQQETVRTLETSNKTAILKARQLGFSWAVIGWGLWHMCAHPAATVLLFSKRDDEAIELLDRRMKGMYDRLPQFIRDLAAQTNPQSRQGREQTDSKHQWQLPNGSRAIAFPSTGGRSYTGSIAIVDEADFIPNLDGLLNAVKPTVDAGGKLVVLSTVDKTKPQSRFKRIFEAARDGSNGYTPVFYGWDARPGRTQEWYEQECREKLAETGSLDVVYQEYPQTPEQAMAPLSADKRIHADWLAAVFIEQPLYHHPSMPASPGLEIYRPPQPGRQYVIGMDPAEGNPGSDDSALEVLDKSTGEEVACLAGKLQPEVLTAHADTLGRWYNSAGILCERNNHGHACILWLRTHSHLPVIAGHDLKPGWLSNVRGKPLMYDKCAEAIRDKEVIIHSRKTLQQLQSIEGATLRAPEGMNDDRADAFALAVMAAFRAPPPTTAPFVGAPGPTGIGYVSLHREQMGRNW